MARIKTPSYQYYNSLKAILKKTLRSGFVVKNIDLNLRRLLYFTALKRHCYLEQIIEAALREYLSKDKTVASFLECDFEIDFEESFHIRKKDFTATPKNESFRED